MRRQRGSSPPLLLLFASIFTWTSFLSSSSPLVAEGACSVRFVIDPASSPFTFDGTNSLVPPSQPGETVYPIAAPLTDTSPSDVTKAFQGALYAVGGAATHAGACPTTLAGWAAALSSPSWGLSSLTLDPSTAGGAARLVLFPVQLQAETAGNPYFIDSYEANVSTTFIDANATTGAFSMNGVANLVKGFIASSSYLTGARFDDVAYATNGTFSGQGTLSVQDQLVTLNLTEFSMNLTGIGHLELYGTLYESIAEIRFRGNMLLQADMSCGVYCGDFGRCVRDLNGTSGCQCQCGWAPDSSGACTVSSGFCPVFGELSGNCSLVEPGSPSSSPSRGGGGVTVGSAVVNEGSANVYRPIIAFVPVMWLSATLLILVATMISARHWLYASSSSRPYPPGVAVSSPPGPVAEGYEGEGVEESRRGDALAANGQDPGPGLADEQQQLSSPDAVIITVPPPSAPPLPPSLPSSPNGMKPQQFSQPSADKQGAPTPVPYSGHPTPPVSAEVITLRFDSISAWVSKKPILRRVTGEAQSGEVLGILGPSGSGKSTLLNILTGELPSASGVESPGGGGGGGGCGGGRGGWKVTGEVSLAERAGVGRRELLRACAYVPQNSALLPHLTVEECLRYAAAFSLDSSVGLGEARERVESVMQELGISHLRHSYTRGGGGNWSVFSPRKPYPGHNSSSSSPQSPPQPSGSSGIKGRGDVNKREGGRGGVGSNGGLSGGERLRVCIGMELVSDARLLILDEPTSGLDSYNAQNLMNLLTRVALGTPSSSSSSSLAPSSSSSAAGVPNQPLSSPADTSAAPRRARPPRIVIASLHQPSPGLFDTLDQVMLLVQGRRAFLGPPSEASGRFAALGLPLPSSSLAPLPANTATPTPLMMVSMAEHMLMVAGDPLTLGPLIEKLDKESSNPAAAATAAKDGRTGEVRRQMTTKNSSEEGEGCIRGRGKAGSQPIHSSSSLNPSSSSSSWLEKVVRRPGAVFWRSWVLMWRNPTLFILHCAGSAAMGLLVGFVFHDIQAETTGGVIGRLGTLFFTINVVAFPSLTAMDLILEEKSIVERELRQGYYSPFTYMVSKLVLDGLFLRVVPSVIYGTIFYWLVGLRATATAFTLFLGVLVSFNALIGALVLALVVLLGSPGKTLIATTTLLLIFALFSGFLAPISSMTWVLRWITYVSPFRWSWMALVTNEIRPLSLTLSIADLPPVSGYSGSNFLSSLGVDPTLLTTYIVALVIEYFGMALLAVLVLYGRGLCR